MSRPGSDSFAVILTRFAEESLANLRPPPHRLPYSLRPALCKGCEMQKEAKEEQPGRLGVVTARPEVFPSPRRPGTSPIPGSPEPLPPQIATPRPISLPA